MHTSTMATHAAALPIDPLIAEAKHRARARRFVVLTAFALACLAVGLFFVLRPSGGPSTRLIRADGVSTRIPTGWYVTHRPFTAITDPVQRFVVSSYRIPDSLFSGTVPSGSTYLPSSTGVLAVVMEQLPATRSPDWKPLGRLHLDRPGRMESFTGQRWQEFTFRLNGRDFYAFAWAGRHVSREERNQLLSILEGMTTS